MVIDRDIGRRLRAAGFVKDDEDLSVLHDRWLFVQGVRGYRFGIDAVVLARYASGLVGPEVPESATVLDIGTGCGVAGVILAGLCPSVAVTGVEIQPIQADRARRNVDLNGLAGRMVVSDGDVLDLAATERRFDLVISNPPFYRSGSGRVNPDGERAVARHEIALTMVGLFRAVAAMLTPDGRAVVLYPAERLSECIRTATRCGLAAVRQVPLLSSPGAPVESHLVELVHHGVDSIPDLINASPMYLSRDVNPPATSECGR